MAAICPPSPGCCSFQANPKAKTEHNRGATMATSRQFAVFWVIKISDSPSSCVKTLCQRGFIPCEEESSAAASRLSKLSLLR